MKKAVAGIEQEYRVVPDSRIHAHEEQRLRKRDGVRERNQARMERQVPAMIRDEGPGESLRRAAPRPSR